jgi:D-lactate dehydrogenase (cytochrome)
MLTKTQTDAIQSFVEDSSHLRGGYAERVVFPETAQEVTELLAGATKNQTPVTVSGAGTGTVAGRVPFGGIVLATEKLNQIKAIVHDERGGGHALVEAGVILADLQRAVEAEGLMYPPDPTERSCFLGGNVATNASGARTFKYGPTRNYIERLKIALASGDVIDLRRGAIHADQKGRILIPLPSGEMIAAQLPTYSMPCVRKNASGYFVSPGMDVIDLFIGSEGTLGVIVEIQLKLLPKPAGLLSGVVFFKSDEALLGFVKSARSRSLGNRGTSPAVSEGAAVDARALEYFDVESLRFLRQKYAQIPLGAAGAIFFEQETTATTEDAIMTEWLDLLESHQALTEASWFATNAADQAKLREFRHALPVLMNEWFARHQQSKVSTDMCVPDEAFEGMLRFYQDSLRGGNLRYTIFGHIGDNHVHVNILPRDDHEAMKAREIYQTFIRRAIEVGGTISAEHGIGKLKREYLRELYGDDHLREMAALKRAFDPAWILGRGNIFAEDIMAR